MRAATIVLAIVGGWFLLSIAVTLVYALIRRRAKQRAEDDAIRSRLESVTTAFLDKPGIYDWRREQLDARDVDLAFRKVWATEWPRDWERAIARGDT